MWSTFFLTSFGLRRLRRSLAVVSGAAWQIGGETAYRALSMGSAILWKGIVSKKVIWRGDLGTMARMGAAMWLAAAGAPVPNASKVGGSVVVRESALKSPIAVSRQAEVDLTSSSLNVQMNLHVLAISGYERECSEREYDFGSFDCIFGALLPCVCSCCLSLTSHFSFQIAYVDLRQHAVEIIHEIIHHLESLVRSEEDHSTMAIDLFGAALLPGTRQRDIRGLSEHAHTPSGKLSGYLRSGGGYVW